MPRRMFFPTIWRELEEGGKRRWNIIRARTVFDLKNAQKLRAGLN
jgi:hypothetical protein